MSASSRVLRRRLLHGGAFVPAAVLAALIGAPAVAAAPAAGLAPHVAMDSALRPMTVAGIDDSLPENPDLLRQLMWVRAGKVPAVRPGDLRVATYSAGLTRSAPGMLADELSAPGSAQAQRVAETVQRAAPDVVLLTDFDVAGGDEAAHSFRTNYLAVGTGGQQGIDYPYVYTSEVNNGVDTGADLDDDGVIGGPGDSFGPGDFAGQHGMVLFSRHPIDADGIRTFQELRWDSMPGNSIPYQAYTDLERSVLRLSSTAHWDIPVRVGGRTVHVLAAQTANPSARTSSAERHQDELRFWADYVSGEAGYVTDDDGRSGGLDEDSDFVIVGDYGPHAADDLGADHSSGIATLLSDEAVQDPEPESAGARAAGPGHASATRVVRDDDGVRLERSDYVLPSPGLPSTASGVFWPADGQLGSHLTRPAGAAGAGPAAERRLVWTDLDLD